MRRLIPVLVVAILAGLASIAVGPQPVQAADVSVTLIAKNIDWHVGSEPSTETTIRVNVGDTLRLRIENRDNVFHTFTAPQFPAATGQGGGGSFLNISLDAGAIFFWNYTVPASDVGSWQYYCIPHSGGTYPSRQGMIGLIAVTQATPPGGDNTLLLVAGGILVVVVIVAAATLMMRRRPKPPAQPPAQP